MSAATLAKTGQGVLRGAVEDGVCVFRGVPYARPPVGELRFAEPREPLPWTGERDATRDGSIAPQPLSRLRAAMGDFERPQSEDCLTLTITTPAPDHGQRPVIVWLHGGAYWTGAGSLPWYSGSSWARHGDVVVVSVNYRLGAFGYLYVPDTCAPNLGLRDQMAALAWVQREIAAFGGDPENVTLAGQSAGASSTLLLLGIPAARARFRRAIVQSAAFGRILRPLDEAAEVAGRLGRELGIRSPEEWREVDAARINAAQLPVARDLAVFGSSASAFRPIVDHTLIGDNHMAASQAGAAEKDLLLGFTRDEMEAFYAIDERVRESSRDTVLQVFRQYFGASAEEAMDEYAERCGNRVPAHLLSAMVTDATFAGGLLGYAERLAQLGRPAWVYRFDWRGPASRFGACHTVELPFSFDTLPNWKAPMLDGGDPAAMQRLAAQMRDAWIAFARSGNPQHAGLAGWEPHRAAGETMILDDPCTPADDPAGRRKWRYWP
jgi:para-nitrobenzyl esterase